MADINPIKEFERIMSKYTSRPLKFDPKLFDLPVEQMSLNEAVLIHLRVNDLLHTTFKYFNFNKCLMDEIHKRINELAAFVEIEIKKVLPDFIPTKVLFISEKQIIEDAIIIKQMNEDGVRVLIEEAESKLKLLTDYCDKQNLSAIIAYYIHHYYQPNISYLTIRLIVLTEFKDDDSEGDKIRTHITMMNKLQRDWKPYTEECFGI